MTEQRGTIVQEWDDVDGCEMEGCRGHLVQVRWPNGEITHNCSGELTYRGRYGVELLREVAQ